jgi:hypothetical protein
MPDVLQTEETATEQECTGDMRPVYCEKHWNGTPKAIEEKTETEGQYKEWEIKSQKQVKAISTK